MKHGLEKSSLQTILASKSRQCMYTAETDGKAIEGRGKHPYWNITVREWEPHPNPLIYFLFLFYEGRDPPQPP